MWRTWAGCSQSWRSTCRVEPNSPCVGRTVTGGIHRTAAVPEVRCRVRFWAVLLEAPANTPERPGITLNLALKWEPEPIWASGTVARLGVCPGIHHDVSSEWRIRPGAAARTGEHVLIILACAGSVAECSHTFQVRWSRISSEDFDNLRASLSKPTSFLTDLDTNRMRSPLLNYEFEFWRSSWQIWIFSQGISRGEILESRLDADRGSPGQASRVQRSSCHQNNQCR